MSHPTYNRLEDVVLDELFPEVDQALREGVHVDQETMQWYGFLEDALEFLEPLYERYGLVLTRAADGYFFLVPLRETTGRQRLSIAEMLVGQALALMLLDPSTVQAGGSVKKAQLVELLVSLVGEERLLQALNPRRSRRDERVEQELARKEVDRALRTLNKLGFIDVVDPENLRLRAALLRFAEAVRATDEPARALERMIGRGEADVDQDHDEHEPEEDES
ncbi:MAG: chromosome partition protein MukE [Bradymonadaceae bacterium]|nr:chromosome partition protein MukE [Lujinxingiaceae bacterium]